MVFEGAGRGILPSFLFLRFALLVSHPHTCAPLEGTPMLKVEGRLAEGIEYLNRKLAEAVVSGELQKGQAQKWSHLSPAAFGRLVLTVLNEKKSAASAAEA